MKEDQVKVFALKDKETGEIILGYPPQSKFDTLPTLELFLSREDVQKYFDNYGAEGEENKYEIVELTISK